MDVTINSSDEFYRSVLKRIDWKTFEKNFIEQICFRAYICRECVNLNKCQGCGCNVIDSLTDYISCNKTKRFPNFKSPKDWADFKKQHNLTIL